MGCLQPGLSPGSRHHLGELWSHPGELWSQLGELWSQLEGEERRESIGHLGGRKRANSPSIVKELTGFYCPMIIDRL